MLESRLSRTPGSKSSTLPSDYLRMVEEVFSSNFDEGLKLLQAHQPESRFEAQGEVFQNEVVLAISIAAEGKLAATTIYASQDFDPAASAPALQDLLEAAVDAAGDIVSTLLDPSHPAKIKALSQESTSDLEGVPLEWVTVKSGKFTVHLKVDKANLSLDQAADYWLKKNVPNFVAAEEEEQRETGERFVTGDKAKHGVTGTGSGSGRGSSDLH